MALEARGKVAKPSLPAPLIQAEHLPSQVLLVPWGVSVKEAQAGIIISGELPSCSHPRLVPSLAPGRRPPHSLLVPGVYFPALTSLLSQKVRESERAFIYSTVGAGSQFG